MNKLLHDYMRFVMRLATLESFHLCLLLSMPIILYLYYNTAQIIGHMDLLWVYLVAFSLFRRAAQYIFSASTPQHVHVCNSHIAGRVM